MVEYIVDLTTVRRWEDFIEAFNEGFVRLVDNAEWNGNLDAFNDYLWWPNEHPYRLIIRGWQLCYSAISEHKTQDGLLVLDVIIEILEQNTQAEVILA